MSPRSPGVRMGDRRVGAAVEAPEEGEPSGEGEARAEVEAPAEAPGEGPPRCTGVMSREPGEPLGEARPKYGFSVEHPGPYMV